MKDVKDILSAYEETPSADVWKRLNAQLDVEMPVTGKVHRIQRVTVWKWTAAVLSALIIGGAVTLGVFLHNHGNQDVIVENDMEMIESQVVDVSDAISKPQEIVEQETNSTKETSVKSPQPRVDQKSEEKKTILQPNTQEVTVAPKSNSPQKVLPPNSTLAKQLAADPVLKKLSDDSVDWSLPVHFSIPNLFTPNKDGVNDYFVIEGLENYSSPKLVVRDKNNRVVYQSETYKNTWDGGTCPDGVYSYEFTFSYNGIENQASGKVRIIRS